MTFARKARRAAVPLQLPPAVPPPDPDPDPGYAWSTLGPNAPAGLTSPFTDFTGDTMPAKSSTFGGLVPNAQGMGSTYADGRAWELVSDAASPSGQALRWNFYGKASPRLGVAFVPPDAGGGAPVFGHLRAGIYDAGVPRKWTKLYVHLWYRFSPNFSVAARLMTPTTHYTGTATSGSTITVVNDTTKSWAVNELVGKYVRHGTSKGSPIISNTVTSLTVAAGDQFNYAFSGESYTIFSWAETGTTSTSAGCKGWFWPQQTARMVGPVAGVGDGAILGAWDAPKDFSDRWPENHFHACWQNFVGGGAGAPGGIWEAIALQLNKRWDPPYVETASDLPIWSGSRFTQYPPPAPLPYTPGDLVKAEYYLQMNTPGIANGIFRVHHNGLQMREITDIMYCERYVSAQDTEGSTGVARPVIGGSPRDVAYEIAECYWGNLWSAMTFGGIPSNYVPENTQWADLLCMGVSGAP